MTPFIVVIPARFDARRLPGKPLVEVGGMPLLQHAHQAALGSDAEDIIIATDDERIEKVAKGFGAKVAMTSPAHRSGTERIAEVAAGAGWPEARIVVNVQGDEVGLPPALINQVAANLAARNDAAMATLCEPIRSAAELRDPGKVKVAFDHRGLALFFSRSPIPWQAPGAPSAGPRGMLMPDQCIFIVGFCLHLKREQTMITLVYVFEGSRNQTISLSLVATIL